MNKPHKPNKLITELKNLKEIESPEYDAVLKKVAVRIPDRKLLFNYLI